MLLTLARRQETCSAQWRDVDWKAGTFTIRDTKNGEPHLIPLPHQAVALLRARLPKDGTGATIDPAPDALIFATSTGGALPNWDREAKRLIVASGLAAENEKTGEVTMKDRSLIFTRHDLRRTGATMLGEMGELPDIIEAALNHVSIRSPLAATYNRSRYRPQVAAALQRLADALDGIEAGAAKVVPLHATVTN
jgi:integrase